MRADQRRRLKQRRQPGLETLEQRVVMDAAAPWSTTVDGGAVASPSFVDWTDDTASVTTLASADAAAGFALAATPPAAPPALRMTVQPTVIRGTAAAFVLTLPAPAGPGGASVAYRTADIGAKAGVDYRATSGRITFAPGQTVKQVAVETIAGLPASAKPLTMGLVLSEPVGVKLGTSLAVTTIVNREQQFNKIFGYGLVNAAAAVAQASGRIAPFTPVADLGGDFWGEDLVKAPEAWAAGYTGRGVVVAVIDSGVDYTHPDLASNIWVNSREIPNDGIDNDANGFVDDIRGWNFNGNRGLGSNDPMDDNGHGTHVAGTIAALRNGVGVTGVAPNAKIMPLKVKDPTAPTFDDYHTSVAKAIRYAVDNGARVINMSIRTLPELGPTISFGSRPVAAIQDALAYAAAALPGRAYSTMYGLSVGALDSKGQIASFSNYAGTSPSQHQVMGPGVDVYSTLPFGSYGYESGTSMASPHVAGVVALMVGANPRITSNQVRSIVTSTAERLTGQIITARVNRPASLPLLAVASGLDQPIWVVPGSAVGGDSSRPAAPRLPGAVLPATLPAATFAAMGTDELTTARRQRYAGSPSAPQAVTVQAGGAADGLLPRDRLIG